MTFLENWNDITGGGTFQSNTGGGNATTYGRLSTGYENIAASSGFSPSADSGSSGKTTVRIPAAQTASSTPGIGAPIAESGNVTQDVQLSPAGTAQVILGFIFVAVGLSLFRIPQVVPVNSVAGNTLRAVRRAV
jgi:hypothetical protein